MKPEIGFYWQHREQIDEWHSLRKAAVQESNLFFETLVAKAIEVKIHGKGIQVKVCTELDKTIGSILLYKDHWLKMEHQDPFSWGTWIALAWWRKEVAIGEPWIEVQVGENIQNGSALDETLRSKFAALRDDDCLDDWEDWLPISDQLDGKSCAYWESEERLQNWADHLAQKLICRWNEWHQIIDDTLKEEAAK